ncbi:bifunctional methionine sulfoxide reductase B/A protein [Sulfurimonas sp. NWX79]|uniref:bifunctional methionine sulfoxide reductase B/A protein n=1 Tax=Sulfurimonas sp. NWX79 TaxID=2925412 RepID=UPI0032047C75
MLFVISLLHADGNKLQQLKLNKLTEEEQQVILFKATERPFSGKYYKFNEEGVYLCKQCNAPLYKSSDKFDAHCGWPSFDDAIPGAVKRVRDADGYRTEILCAQCGAHLGHVFLGEGFTQKDTRYCVNSLSLNFQKADAKERLKQAYFAGGCFWGVEYYLEKQKGVKNVVSGYMGGKMKNPTYRDVSRGNSGYLEVVEVTYDPQQVSYESLVKLFFEIHDPTQKEGQGPDIGSQYKSAIFVSNEKERKTVQKLIRLLESKSYDIATEVKEKKVFYKAEAYHQNYYERKRKKPYCHAYVKRF